MEEAKESACDAVLDGLRHLGDISYAVLPHDVAHAVGDLKKSLLSTIRSCIDWEIEWIDDRVAGGDRLREDWQHRCEQRRAEAAGDSAT